MNSAFFLCARQELLLAVRSRWTQLFAAVFAVLSLAVAFSGYVLSGGHGVQDFSRTTASLVQLVLLLVPLASILVGVLTLIPDGGATELLFSQPVSRRTILLGRVTGLLMALTAAQLIGFGAAGLVIYSNAGDAGFSGFALMVAGSAVLTSVFLGLAALVSVGSAGRRRTRSLALGLVVWFATAILVDLAALGVASLLPSGPASRVLIVSVLANPSGALRTGAFLALEGTAAFGPASLALLRFTHGPLGAAAVIAVALLLWAVLPALLAARRLQRTDL
ncbi:MAG: ABC transporter permease [Acidithiobacillales bacterium]